MNDAVARIEDEGALRRLVLGYARAADAGDGEAFADLFCDGGTLERDGLIRGTRAELEKIPRMLREKYLRTYHQVHNCYFAVRGDEATGEIYSVAHHLRPGADGGIEDYHITITYQDRYIRTDGGWRFGRREVVSRWKAVVPVDLSPI